MAFVLASTALRAQTTFNYTGAVQSYTVPVGVTSVTIDASGAQGGGSFGGAGGLGARMQGTFAVTPGEVLSVVVGQQGLLQVGGNAQNSSGGGGGTFVFRTGPSLLVAAGGGGGKCNYTSSGPLHSDAAGQITTSGGASSDGNPGGTGGAGGPAGLWSAVACAGGGAGWNSNGGGPYGGLGYNTWTGGPGYCGGGGGGCGGVGGYGGGGGGGNHYGGGGGGGGYSGGGGGTDPTHGGGGGSFSIGTSQSNTPGFKTGNGEVVIVPLVSPCATPTNVTATPSAICLGSSADLNAISTGNNIDWFTQPVGGVSLGTSASGANFTVSPTVTTTYYAEAVGTGGSSGTQTFNYTGSVQTFTVPVGVTSISIDARGAQGGGSFGGAGGLGARMTGNFTVTPGQVLSVVVGEQGLLQVGGNAQNSSGGGGGSFVFGAGPTLLVAAGGGGGKCNYTSSGPLHGGAAGQITAGGGASSDGNPGGTGGAGGPAGLWSAVPCAGGGTGWNSNGGGPYGGLGYNTWTGGPGFCGGGGGGCGGVGGFGGGGGGGNHYGGGGGGGGYSGGGGGTDPTHGGGGGSYSIGTSQVNTAGSQTGNGQVIIAWSGGTSCTASTRDSVVVTVYSAALAGTVMADTTTCGYNVSCDGAADGVATVSATGGCPSYSYQWSNGATTSTVTGLAVGTYTVTITDGGGATSVQTVVLTSPAVVIANGVTTSTCSGDSTGDIDVTAAGGNDCAGYTFLWSNGATSEDLTGLTAGTYSVTVTDASGCTGTQSFTVGTFAAPSPAITATGNVLNSVQTWSSYQWLFNGGNISGANANTYTATQNGVYSLMVTDSNGCSGVSDTVHVVLEGINGQLGDWAELSIFPNPAQDAFKLRTASPIGYAITVNIHDMFGRSVFAKGLPQLGQEVDFDISNLAAGTYMVEVSSDLGQRKLFKLVVQ